LELSILKKIRSFQQVLVEIKKTTHLGYYDTPELAFKAYKTAKEDWIKEVADKWKHLITPEVYKALYNYKVEITD